MNELAGGFERGCKGRCRDTYSPGKVSKGTEDFHGTWQCPYWKSNDFRRSNYMVRFVHNAFWHHYVMLSVWGSPKPINTRGNYFRCNSEPRSCYSGIILCYSQISVWDEAESSKDDFRWDIYKIQVPLLQYFWHFVRGSGGESRWSRNNISSRMIICGTILHHGISTWPPSRPLTSFLPCHSNRWSCDVPRPSWNSLWQICVLDTQWWRFWETNSLKDAGSFTCKLFSQMKVLPFWSINRRHVLFKARTCGGKQHAT